MSGRAVSGSACTDGDRLVAGINCRPNALQDGMQGKSERVYRDGDARQVSQAGRRDPEPSREGCFTPIQWSPGAWS